MPDVIYISREAKFIYDLLFPAYQALVEVVDNLLLPIFNVYIYQTVVFLKTLVQVFAIELLVGLVVVVIVVARHVHNGTGWRSFQTQ